MKQLDLFGLWINGADRMPEPDQAVIRYYLRNDGTLGGPVISTPILSNGCHINEDGTSFMKPTVWWLPIPDLPPSEKREMGDGWDIEK